MPLCFPTALCWLLVAHKEFLEIRNGLVSTTFVPGGPVHAAELWDPDTGQWTLMASEDVDRCYHSTALLLPDGRVLSAGGGEYAPIIPLAPINPTLPATRMPMRRYLLRRTS